ncbi:MAG: MFS transporter [Actinobacteria bacterium]|nr:MFS transporter [Actinomycetota bacterium]
MNQPSLKPGELPESTRTLVLVIASLGGFLVTFMASSINIALPLIGADFDVSAVTLSWISLSYMLVSTVLLLPAGRIADAYGRMRLFNVSMIVFLVMAFASAFAPSASVLIVMRALHGIGLAIGAVTSTALVVLAFPPERRGRALGTNVAFVYLGVTLGPVLGGLICQNLGWRALFIIVGALSLINVVLPLWKLRHVEWREPKGAHFDFLGSVLSGAALVAILVGFSLLPEVLGAVLVAAGIVGLAAFLWWETRAADPLLNLDLFRRSRVFAFSNAASLINYSSTSAMIFLLSLYLQYNRGLSTQTAGFVLVTGPFVQAAFSPMVGRLADRVEARHVASAGMAVCVIGLLGLSFAGADTAFWYIILMLCLVSLGNAFFATPNTHAIMGSVETRWVGVASATMVTMRQVGMSMSLGVAALVLALVVGRDVIRPADYPHLLTSVRVTFLIFTVLCVFGIAASLVGPRRVR